jgi:3-hydroxyisobutyrate dehydrogenase-like beta-hydroxyacid dehydrogenase
MGAHMARRLLDRGFPVVLYDIREAALEPFRGHDRATIASSPREVAELSHTVLVSLPSPKALKAAVTGENGLCTAKGFTTYIDLSTTGPQMAEEIEASLSEHGVVALDAPVSGGVSGAQAGTLAIMVSGPKAAYEAQLPVLETIGSKIFYVGPLVGQGQVMKLTNNYLSAVALAASSEAVVLGVRAGLDPAVMIDIFNAGSGRNSATLDKFPRAMLNRKFDLGFKTGLMYKDVALCMSEADRLGVTMWIGNNTKELWKLAQHTLGAESDFSEIVRIFERWSDVEVNGQSKEAAA